MTTTTNSRRITRAEAEANFDQIEADHAAERRDPLQMFDSPAGYTRRVTREEAEAAFGAAKADRSGPHAGNSWRDVAGLALVAALTMAGLMAIFAAVTWAFGGGMLVAG